MRQSTRATRPCDIYEPEGPSPRTRRRAQLRSRRAARVAAPPPHLEEATAVRKSSRATRPRDFYEPEGPSLTIRPRLPPPSRRTVARPVPIPFARTTPRVFADARLAPGHVGQGSGGFAEKIDRED